MASTAEITPSSTYTPVQILALKDTLKTAIDKENNIDLLRKCALLLSTNKDMYDLVRRLECGDIPWLKLWKRYYENEQDESVKFSILKWGVRSLVYEDMRTIPLSCVFSNSRHSFSEIHEDYARVLGVGVEDVSLAIEALISGRFLEKKESVLGVVYVGSRMYDRLDMVWRYE